VRAGQQGFESLPLQYSFSSAHCALASVVVGSVAAVVVDVV